IGPVGFDIGYRFFNSRNDRFEDMGIGLELDQSPVPITLRNNPEDIIYRFPLTYGRADTTFSVSELDLGSLGIFYRKEQTRITTVDGWGDLSTPFGTFPSLRVKAEINARDSIAYDTLAFGFNRPKQVLYQWLGESQSIPLLEINTFEVGGQSVPVTIRYKDSLREDEPVGIFDHKASVQLAKLYPNPAKDQIRIELNEPNGKWKEIEILTLAGRQIWAGEISDAILSIPVSTFPAGMYLVKIRDGQNIQTGKLIVR
ncbi:MAG: T9SS type A sorting domain-containing protein, partial [Bacteroidota bacterium]